MAFLIVFVYILCVASTTIVSVWALVQSQRKRARAVSAALSAAEAPTATAPVVALPDERKSQHTDVVSKDERLDPSSAGADKEDTEEAAAEAVADQQTSTGPP
jgi:hypothetical protein